MAVRPSYIQHQESSKNSSTDQSPVLTLLYLSGQGIVFKSHRSFDTGTKLAIGLHLDKIREDLGIADSAHCFDLNPFINVQGFVADCKITETSLKGAGFQVTLLFDQLSESDQMMVDSIEREVKLLKQFGAPAPKPKLPAHRKAGLN